MVIPTNRGGRFLKEAVASVRGQTSQASEIILVDDGSPAPGLAAVAAELGVRYVRQPPGGVSAARNTGVACSTGTWVAFLDDDDVWHPDRLQAQLDALAGRPRANAAYTGGWHMDSSGRRFGRDWSGADIAPEAMLRGDVDIPRITTLLVRREVYLAVGGCNSAMEPSEDNDLILRLLQTGDFAGVDRALVGYRRHGANVTATETLRGRAAGRRVVIALLRDARARNDVVTESLLRENLRRTRSKLATANLGDLVDAVRARRWPYATRVAWWGASRLPVESTRAVLARGQARVRHRAQDP